MHGGSPRVRHRQNSDEKQQEVIIDTGELINNVASSTIGAIVGGAVTTAIYKRGKNE